MSMSKKIQAIVKHIILVIVAAIFIFPLVWMVILSLQSVGLKNYTDVLQEVKIGRNIINSIIVTTSTILIVVTFTSLAAFAFSKLQFRGKNILYIILLLAMMTPAAATIFPLFQVVKGMHLINNPAALIGPYAASNCIFNLLILRNYYDGLPYELMEAGMIDGCNTFQSFIKIMFPLSYPALAVVIIWTFLNCWNEFFLGMIFINKAEYQTVTVLPLRFAQTMSNAGSQGQLYAILVIILCPIIILYLFMQKFFVEGITSGAIK
jgi:raffinose/stachyose/melibiose transport system permease protein